MAWATRLAGRDPKVPGSTAATLRQHGLLNAKHPANPLSRLSNSANQPGIVDLTPAEREYFEERAGIREFDGGFRRETAERLALNDVLRIRGGGDRA